MHAAHDAFGNHAGTEFECSELTDGFRGEILFGPQPGSPVGGFGVRHDNAPSYRVTELICCRVVGSASSTGVISSNLLMMSSVVTPSASALKFVMMR